MPYSSTILLFQPYHNKQLQNFMMEGFDSRDFNDLALSAVLPCRLYIEKDVIAGVLYGDIWWYIYIYKCFLHGPLMVCHGFYSYHGIPDLSSTSSSRIHHGHRIVVISWSWWIILDLLWPAGHPRRRRLSSSPSAPPARPISHRPSRRRLRTAFRLEPAHPMGQRHRKRRTLVTVDGRLGMFRRQMLI